MRSRRLAIVVSSGALGAVLAGSAGVPAQPGLEPGQRLFAEKQCDRCHRPRGEPGMGPPYEDLRRPQGEMELAGRLWNHVPDMLASLGQTGLDWPRVTTAEMAALMTYLGADAGRDATPEPAKGQAMVVRKGCLKCHSLRREGGRIHPDLADHRADYESAAAWAAAMWMHSPRMVSVAATRGVPYPRFAGDEMGNLLAYLRQVAAGAPRRTGGSDR
jgi:cytochrome c551/c552